MWTMTWPIAVRCTARLALACCVVSVQARAQDAAGVRSAVRAYQQAHDVDVVHELADFLAIPNLANDSINIRRNARFIMQMLERRGARARLLEAPGSPPAVYGELRAPGATRTVVFYAHSDGQPVDSSQWTTSAWSPTLRS